MWHTIYGVRYEIQKSKNIIGRLAYVKDKSDVGLIAEVRSFTKDVDCLYQSNLKTT